MKRLCVLEQSGTINDPYTAEKKKLFETKNSDFFRLNWSEHHDPDADIAAPGVVWSEGRSLLFEHAPKTYDYYLFMDDDIRFSWPEKQPLDQAIISLLDEYRPLSASCYCKTGWGRPNPVSEEMRRHRKAFPFLCLDLQLTIYSRDFAEFIFPVPFHGSDKSMWYAYWIANKLSAGKQICFSDIVITNTRSVPHHNSHVRNFRDGLVYLFNSMTYEKSFNWDIPMILAENKKLFECPIAKEPLPVSLDQLKQLFNVESIYMTNRSSRVSTFHDEIVTPQLQRFIKS